MVGTYVFLLLVLYLTRKAEALLCTVSRPPEMWFHSVHYVRTELGKTQ
jgi:hypothetical protein